MSVNPSVMTNHLRGLGIEREVLARSRNGPGSEAKATLRYGIRSLQELKDVQYKGHWMWYVTALPKLRKEPDNGETAATQRAMITHLKLFLRSLKKRVRTELVG
jgi:hypothetical protein